MANTRERPPHGWFTVRTQKPRAGEIQRVLSRARAPLNQLVQFLEETYHLKSSLHYMYGPRYGWAFRFERAGRLVLALYPNRARFTLQVILGPAQVQTALRMRLSPLISKVLRSARKYPEGRWLFIPVRSASGVRSLRSLIALKITGSKH